jgi:hypothetical protein
MPRPSKIDRAPAEVREAIGKLRGDGHTIDEILVHLAKMGLDDDGMPSRSGLHRHVQGLDALAETISRGRTIAEALVRRLGDAPEGRQARLNIELMHNVVTQLVAAAGDTDGTVKFDAKQVQFLTRSLANLASAQKSDVDVTLRLKRELAAEMDKKLAEVEAGVDGEAEPLTPAQMIARIRALYSGEG